MAKWKVNEGLDWADRIERLCKKEDGHWLWQGYTYSEDCPSPDWPQYMVRDSEGSGHLSPRRVIWKKYREGSIDGVALRTTCGIGNCVAPDHLYKPTKNKDKASKQRAATELKNKRANRIRLLHSAGHAQNLIAQMVGVHESTVSLIVRGKRRKEVE